MSLRSRIAVVAALLVLAAVAVNTVLQTLAARRAILDQARSGGDGIAGLLARAVAFAEDVPTAVEDEIGRHMLAEARLLAAYAAAAERAGISGAAMVDQLRSITDETIIDQLLVTGTDGVGSIDTERPAHPFTFLADPIKQPEAHVFHRLLSGELPALVQKALPRDQDGRVFKYAGVGGIDKPRIVEVGIEATFRERLDRQFGVRRLVDELVGGDVREVQILDPQLVPVYSRWIDESGAEKGDAATLQQADADLVRESLTTGQPIGRFAGDTYRVAAAVTKSDVRRGAGAAGHRLEPRGALVAGGERGRHGVLRRAPRGARVDLAGPLDRRPRGPRAVRGRVDRRGRPHAAGAGRGRRRDGPAAPVAGADDALARWPHRPDPGGG
jgi:hypothetical protein